MKMISNIIDKIFKRTILDKVFTPGTIATSTYVKRASVENEVVKFLRIPGIQLVLYGYSGCGKSTLIINNLKNLKINHKITRCTTETTFNDILISAFNQLEVYYKSEKIRRKQSSFKGEIGANAGYIAKAGSGYEREVSVKESRVGQNDISIERLAKSFGEQKLLWIIEDFHKVDIKEKKQIADMMKIFSDSSYIYPATKIVCIGAVATARELIELDDNLSERVAQIAIPLLSDDNILEIITKGTKLLNVVMTDELQRSIAFYSNNLALICHQLCYDICYNKSIEKTVFKKILIDDSIFSRAVEAQLNKKSDTLKKLYDKITSSRIRKLILKAFHETNKTYMTIDEIYQEITTSTQTVTATAAQKQIEQMISTKYDEVLRVEEGTMMISFSNQFFKSFVRMSLDIEKAEKEFKQKQIQPFFKFTPKKSVAHREFMPYIDYVSSILKEETIERYLRIHKNEFEDNLFKKESLLPPRQSPILRLSAKDFKKKQIPSKYHIKANVTRRQKTIPRNNK